MLKIGVMSDLHLSYDYDDCDAIKRKVTEYAKAVGTLQAMAGNELDVLMLAGDYTSCGSYEQGKIFASASRAVMDAIGSKTQFFMAYGNHDTEWDGQMSYAEWESLLQEYHLLDGVTFGPENAGCYQYRKSFFSLETERYYVDGVTNMFRTDVLEWLDQELAKAPKDRYVYIVSHGPIKETGVYGADLEYDTNADWGTSKDGYTGSVTRNDGNWTKDTGTYALSSSLHEILKKYPQVVYFSGHTHRTNRLESTIMSKDYVAVNVSHFAIGDLYSSGHRYLDQDGGTDRAGYSLYMEVDDQGNLSITRVNTNASTVVKEVEVSGMATEKAYFTDKITLTYDSEGHVEALPTWELQAPTEDGTHLTKYSAEARRENPVFYPGEAVYWTEEHDELIKVRFVFPTAKCEHGYVIRYELSFSDDTQWILGNWTNNTDGVTEEGKTHLDATTLTYTKIYRKTQLQSVEKPEVKVTAVNEFGGKTVMICKEKKIYETPLLNVVCFEGKNIWTIDSEEATTEADDEYDNMFG